MHDYTPEDIIDRVICAHTNMLAPVRIKIEGNAHCVIEVSRNRRGSKAIYYAVTVYQLRANADPKRKQSWRRNTDLSGLIYQHRELQAHLRRVLALPPIPEE